MWQCLLESLASTTFGLGELYKTRFMSCKNKGLKIGRTRLPNLTQHHCNICIFHALSAITSWLKAWNFMVTLLWDLPFYSYSSHILRNVLSWICEIRCEEADRLRFLCPKRCIFLIHKYLFNKTRDNMVEKQQYFSNRGRRALICLPNFIQLLQT